jgi:predicted cupin superfamily sugar epimerase
MTRAAGGAGQAAVRRLLRLHDLKPHPEGGFFRETYRSPAPARTPRGRRPWATAIIFLLEEGDFSALHRIKSDELWHFYAGGPLRVSTLRPGGGSESVLLGSGHKCQHLVPAGRWFGAAPEPGSGWSLVGCTVSPGFDFRDFELGSREKLLKQFPRAAKIIRELTRQG